MAAREWYVLSDLHLDGGPGARDVDTALPQFLETVVGASTAGRRTLILLGDTFDLHGPVHQSEAGVAARLTSLADAHAGIFDALAGCIRSGTALHVVGGNHDVELARPATATLFAALLGLEPCHPGVRVSPWIVHEPGVFYAEHGNQHHELNRMPTVLSVREEDGRRGPPVTPLRAASRGSAWCAGEGATAVRVARSLTATHRHERLRRSPWYQTLLDREASGLGVSGRALAEVAALSRFSLGGSPTAAVWRCVERRLGVQRQGGYLAPRAAAIHRILTRHGVPAAAYVFGHNHRAERLDLPGPPPAAYLNAGTWSAAVRGPGPDRANPRLFPFVRITDTGTHVTAEVRFWRHDR